MSKAATKRMVRAVIRPRSRIEALEARLAEVTSQVASQQGRLQRHRQRLDGHRDRLDVVEGKVANLAVVFARLEHQVAALEVRAGSADADPVALLATDAEMGEARRLLDEVEREHARIRTRFQVVTRYEERVRRLEEALKPTPDIA
jgi:chromosome segregation ATPase